ncbi:MAG: pantetheine-phosphate adenylyltransferase [Proteobacteria bacterium]|nr:pantetheine-phosphate adenylyltransferase [Pseudomonadota bacterium]
MGNPRVAVYAGTFDPPTNGHLDIIHRASALYDKLIVAVSGHGRKKTLFDQKERIGVIKDSITELKNVEVIGFDNLLYELVESFDAGVVVRGLRVTGDFDFEFQMATMNHELSKQFETVFLMARSRHTIISSTMVKEVATLGGDVSRYIPAAAVPLVQRYFKQVGTK